METEASKWRKIADDLAEELNWIINNPALDNVAVTKALAAYNAAKTAEKTQKTD